MPSIPETSSVLELPAVGQPLALKQRALPRVASNGTAIVRVLSATIRPHNYASFKGGAGLVSFPTPFVPGNSAVARIVSAGSDAVALQPGQLVWISGHVTARDDPQQSQMLLGLHDGGGPEKPAKLFAAWEGLWRDVGVVPLENCYALNEERLVGDFEYSFGDLEYLERLAVAMGGVSAAQLRVGETVIAAPATGHYSGAVAELAAQMGCQVIALTRSAAKLAPLVSRNSRITALELSGDDEADKAAIRALCPEGSAAADVFIDTSPPEATAAPRHLTVGLDALAAGGRAVFLGMMGKVSVDYGSIMFRNISIKGKFMYSRDEMSTLIRMVENGIVKLGKDAGHDVVDGGFKLENWEQALLVASEAKSWGQQVLFTP